MVNDVLAYFLTGAATGGITPTPSVLPTTPAELSKTTAFAQSKGKVFKNPNVLAITLKTSWIEANGLDAGKYITTTATIPVFDQSDPLVWKPIGFKTTTLLLVGMHIEGSAKGMPTELWATF